MLDLQYSEDSRAQVDLNCVMDERGGIIELQGTGEGRAFTPEEQQALVHLCAKGCGELITLQKKALGWANEPADSGGEYVDPLRMLVAGEHSQIRPRGNRPRQEYPL